MKKLIACALTICLMLAALTGCAQERGGAVTTDGSTSMEKVIGALGEAFQNDTGIRFTYNPTGSGSGIKAVEEGRCDIGLSSRALTEAEEAAGLVGTTLAYDGIAVIVSPDNPVSALTLDEIAGIFTGEIRDWAELGAGAGEIVVIGREAGSGTRDGFEGVTGTEDACRYRQELTSTGDVITAVAQNPAAIGYASLAAVKDSVKCVSVNGTEATEANIVSGEYALQRPFILVTRADAALSEAAQSFFDFATSPAANEYISGAGVVPAA